MSGASTQFRGDACSELMSRATLETVQRLQGSFGGPRILEQEGLRQVIVTELPPYALLLNSDGIGTKTEVAERLGRYETLGYDLVAMLTDDAVRYGAQPLSMSNVLDLGRASPGVAGALARGLAQAAQEAQVAVLSGEVAEMGERVQGHGVSEGCIWSGTLLSVLDPERVLTGAELEAGQSVVALREPGFRSNGFTLARKILINRMGESWHEKLAPTGSSWGDELLRPSTIFAPKLLQALGRYGEEPKVRITGLVHVTGGGIPGKLGRLLRGRQLGAELDDLFLPGEAMLELARLGEVKDKTAYETWAMGQGMLAITPEPKALLELLAEAGSEARIVGTIDSMLGIRLVSRGAGSPGKTLAYGGGEAE